MKKTLLRVLLALTLLCSAAYAWREDIMKKLLVIKAKEFITGDFVTKFAQRPKYVYKEGLTFDGLYDDIRSMTYEVTFGNEVRETKSEEDRPDDYYGYRTVAVSVFRSQLHKGDTLKEVYRQIRDSLIEAVKKSGPNERAGLVKFLTRASETFAVVAQKELRQQLAKSLSVSESPDSFFMKCEIAVAKRLSPEQTLKAIGQPTQEVDWSKTPRAIDPDGLKRFALRRFDEGGMVLVKKYQTVINLALADVKAIETGAEK